MRIYKNVFIHKIMLYSNWITEKASGMVRKMAVHVDDRGHNINACDESFGSNRFLL